MGPRASLNGSGEEKISLLMLGFELHCPFRILVTILIALFCALGCKVQGYCYWVMCHSHAHSLYKSHSVSKVRGYGLWICTMEMGTRGRKKAWRKGYEVVVTQFVSVFTVESVGAVLVAGGIMNVVVCQGFWCVKFHTVFGVCRVFH